MVAEFDVHPSRKILVVVTVGGSTNSAPILEICRILADRGHIIEFATLAGREHLAKPYPFVSTVHIIGRAITAIEDEQLYIRLSQWDNRNYQGRKEYLKCKKFYDSFWPETYRALKDVVRKTRPDFIFGDYQLDAARDVAAEFCLPLANMWPQMPWLMAPQSWIPGVPGTQTRCLTSEHASMYDRLFEQTYFLRYAPNLVDLYSWTKKLRKANGVDTMPNLKPHPDHVVLINSLWGLEPAKPVPPLMCAAGPILAEEWAPVTDEYAKYLSNKKSVAFVAFGTHVILSAAVVEKLVKGLSDAIADGHIDGVIWGFRAVARKQLADVADSTVINGSSLSELLQNKKPSWLFVENAPQRALLQHNAVTLFLTHAGPMSATEGLYHGVPMIAMGIYGDQIHESMRLVEAGVALSIDKHTFTSQDVSSAVTAIITDTDGEFRRNVHRMQRIAHVASRRKFHAADLIEEHMYDWGLRFEREQPSPVSDSSENGGRGRQLSPMHLQTADARMSWLRATNTDQKLILAGILATVGLLWRTWIYMTRA